VVEGNESQWCQIMAKIPQLLRLWVEEIALGLVNNYYLYRFTKDNPNFP